MGCMCLRFLNNDEHAKKDKFNEDEEEAPVPVPTIGDTERNHMTIGFSKYKDLSQKRKLAEFLLRNDYKHFNRHLDEMMNLEDEDFFQLFEGNTEYNYNTSNKIGFKELAQKFEDNKDLIMEWYEKEEYYECVLQIWKPNILQKLKSADNEKEQHNILRQNKINISKWDNQFREYFKIIINIRPIKTLAERMKNYIKADYGDFDELIKCVRNCKDKVTPNNHCNKTLNCNLETSENKIINEMIPDFIKKFSEEYNEIKSEFRSKEEKKAIEEILSKGLSKEKEKNLIDEVKKIYGEDENKKKEVNKKEEKGGLFYVFEYNSEYEKLQKLGQRINDAKINDNLYNEEEDEDLIQFNKLNFSEKAKTVFSNKMVKQAILGISLSNVSYSVLHLTQTFMDYKKYSFEFQERLEQIKKNFSEHQNEVKLIDESDIDKSIEQIVECGKKFQSDLDDVENLISDIQKTIKNIEDEKDKTKMNILKSGLTFAASLAGAYFSEGSDRTEYITTAAMNATSTVCSGIDLSKANESLEEFNKYMKEALNLKTQIINEIDKLRNKFAEMSVKHFS